MRSIDINCDLGESYGNFRIGNDEAVFPYISSCNIACGFHGGDPYTIEKTIDLAIQHKVAIGAHPSYPDLMGFGRQKMNISAPQLSSILKYQISALKGLVESRGAQLKYVKPHGALYNSMVKNREESHIVIEAIKSIDEQLIILGLANSHVKEIAESLGMQFAAEAFADRKYNPDGTLMSRRMEGSVIGDPDHSAQQVLSMAKYHKVTAHEGTEFELYPDSICIHGDNPMAIGLLQRIHEILERHDFQVNSFAA